jgi:hypothetical protein
MEPPIDLDRTSKSWLRNPLREPRIEPPDDPPGGSGNGSQGPSPGMASEPEPASKKSRKKCPPRVPDPPRFPHGTDAKTLVTLGPEKNVNLAHTYTLVGGLDPPSLGVGNEVKLGVCGPGSRTQDLAILWHGTDLRS